MANGDLRKAIYPEKEFNKMNIKEIREYVTLFNVRNQYPAIAQELTGQDISQIVQDLNKEWDRRVGEDFVTIYNYLDKKKNTEKWNGEMRYQLFSYLFKVYSEFAIMKQTKAILNYLKESNLFLEQFLKIAELLDYFWFWDMANTEGENYENTANKVCQDEFVDYVLGEMSPEEAKSKPWFNKGFQIK